jgi:hypothetical protein
MRQFLAVAGLLAEELQDARQPPGIWRAARRGKAGMVKPLVVWGGTCCKAGRQ